MKNKALRLLLCTIIGISMISGCGGQSTSTNTDSENIEADEANNENSESISVDKNLLSVEITIPASIYGEEGVDEESLESSKETYPDLEYTINDDGSVSYKMSKSTHQKLMDDLKASLDEGFQEMTNEGSDSVSYTHLTLPTKLEV